MPKFRAYFSMRGYVEVEADSEGLAETKAYDILHGQEHKQIVKDDTEVHCADEV